MSSDNRSENNAQIAETKQARRWCFTYNNPPVNWKEKFGGLKSMTYLLVGMENAPNTGTPHLQGYIEFSSGCRLSTLKRIDKSIHWEICNGTAAQNVAYCKKGGMFEEIGKPSEQGRRTDLEDIRTMIDNKAPMLEVAQEHFGSFVRYHKGFGAYKYLIEQKAAKDFRKIYCEYIWGPTGSGKSRYVREHFTDIFCPMDSNTGVWWTGYSGESCILFDDFRGTVPLHTLLKWIDCYPVQVPIHGGATYLAATTIFFTSNKPLEELYLGTDEASRDALKRRIHKVTFLGRDATEVTGNTRQSLQLPDNELALPFIPKDTHSDGLEAEPIPRHRLATPAPSPSEETKK